MANPLEPSPLPERPIPSLAKPPAIELISCASLPWYDFSEIEWATADFWAAIASRLRGLGLGGVPDELRADDDHEDAWRDPGLLLSQCCGYDAVLPWKDILQVVATPCYRAPGCQGPTYSSLVVVREDSPFRTLADLRGSRCAINNWTSHSGVNGLRALVAPLSRNGRFFSAVLETRSHARSLELIQSRQADVAAIDCVVIELLKRNRPKRLLGIRTLATTPLQAAPPYVTRALVARPAFELIQQALADVVSDPRLADVRAALLLDRVEFLSLEAYEPMVELRRQAHALGYRELDGRSRP